MFEPDPPSLEQLGKKPHSHPGRTKRISFSFDMPSGTPASVSGYTGHQRRVSSKLISLKLQPHSTMGSKTASSKGKKDLHSRLVGLLALAALLWILSDLMG
jgi:hypothetical protein